jgi:hypothetical protein
MKERIREHLLLARAARVEGGSGWQHEWAFHMRAAMVERWWHVAAVPRAVHVVELVQYE